MTRTVADEHITGIQPYVPGKQVAEIQREYGIDDVVKMASNENPLGPSPKALEVIREHTVNVHIYPDGAVHDLKHAVADFHDRPVEEVIFGNGYDQLLRLAVQTMARHGEDHGVVSQHSFGAYPIALRAHDMDYDAVEMADGLRYDLGAMRRAVCGDTRVVFIANPNNPTGTYVDGEVLRSFLRDLPDDVLAIVDEAYHQYVQADDYETALKMREEHELLMVTRTFSKCYGLAGLRLGYAIAPSEAIEAMDRVRAPFNVNRLAQKAGIAALEDTEFLDRSVELNERGRSQMITGLQELEGRGIDWVPSETNFLLVEVPFDGREVYERMLHHGVIVRPMHGYGLPQHLRITIDTEQNNERCLAALGSAISELESGRT
ncbi:MAG: histidinol-phosphate transaminase [Bradymonadaceae bacterium]